MNWYKKIITADVSDYLRSIGKDNPEIEQIIEALRPEKFPHKKIMQFYVNELRKNPNLTLDELAKIPLPNNLVRNPLFNPTFYEERVLRHFPGKMGPWALKNTIKYWRELNNMVNTYDPDKLVEYNTFIAQTIERDDWGGYNVLGEKLAEIKDWYTRSGERIDLASMSFEEAIARSDAWHASMAGQGEGKYYVEKNIVHGPKWILYLNSALSELSAIPEDNLLDLPIEKKEWEGWTIQEVRTKNDLEAEGNKMNNCVGSYYDYVLTNKTRIFSLRDSYNEPHVTIETSPDVKEFHQIKGHSNSQPKEEYKRMIKHWIESLGGRRTISEDDIAYEWDDLNAYATLKDMNNILGDITKQEQNEYGLYTTPALEDINLDFEDVIEQLIKQHSREGYRNEMEYRGEITDSPGAIVNACIQMGKEKCIPELEKVLYKLEQKAYDELMKYWNYECYEDPPNIEDYENDDLYDEAMEKWRERCEEEEEEKIDRYRGNHLPFGLIDDIFIEIRKLREKGVMSPYKQTVNTQSGGWYKKATFLTEKDLQNMADWSLDIVINDGTQYILDAISQVKNYGANPGKISKMLVGEIYRPGNVIIYNGWIYTIGLDNQGRLMVEKVSRP